MANLHVLERNGADIRVAAHIAIPATTNAAGISWQTALVNSGLGGTTVLKDGDGTGGTIAAAEKASLVAGSVYEEVTSVHVTVPTGAAAVNAFLDAAYTEISNRVLTRLQLALNFFGYTR